MHAVKKIMQFCRSTWQLSKRILQSKRITQKSAISPPLTHIDWQSEQPFPPEDKWHVLEKHGGIVSFPHEGRWQELSPDPNGRRGIAAERTNNGKCAGAPWSPRCCKRTKLLSGAPETRRSWGRAVQRPWSCGYHAMQHIQHDYTSAAKSAHCAQAGRASRHLCARSHGRWRLCQSTHLLSTPPPSSWHHQTGPPCTGLAPLSQSAVDEAGRAVAPRHNEHPGAPPGEPR